jgi:hypothetical protein
MLILSQYHIFESYKINIYSVCIDYFICTVFIIYLVNCEGKVRFFLKKTEIVLLSTGILFCKCTIMRKAFQQLVIFSFADPGPFFDSGIRDW